MAGAAYPNFQEEEPDGKLPKTFPARAVDLNVPLLSYIMPTVTSQQL